MSNRHHLTSEDFASWTRELSVHPVNARARRTVSSTGDATGLTTLGINVIEVAPGDKSTEFHVHTCEDEAVFILSGLGMARTVADTHPIHPGDFLGYPKNGPAHEIRNTGDVPLRLLVIGQRLPEDIIDYPDHGKRLYRSAGKLNDLVDVAQIVSLGTAD